MEQATEATPTTLKEVQQRYMRHCSDLGNAYFQFKQTEGAILQEMLALAIKAEEMNPLAAAPETTPEVTNEVQ